MKPATEGKPDMIQHSINFYENVTVEIHFRNVFKKDYYNVIDYLSQANPTLTVRDKVEAEKEKPVNRKIPRWLELLKELSSMTLDAKKSRSVLRLQYLKDTVMRAVGITVANARYEGNKYLNEMREALEAVAELNER